MERVTLASICTRLFAMDELWLLDSVFLQPSPIHLQTKTGRIAGDEITITDDRRARQTDHLLQWHAGRRYALRPLAQRHSRHRQRQMLTKRIVHPRMSNDRLTKRLGQMADAHHSRDATYLERVRLKDVDQALARGLGKRMGRSPMLAGSQRLPRDALTKIGIADHVLRKQHILHPLELVGP